MSYLAEVRHQVPETPAWVAERHPVVIIANATSVLQHGIEYGTTTQDPALWQCATSAVEIGLRSRQQVPIQRAANALSCEEWYLYPRLVIVCWTGFEQEDVYRGIFGEAIRDCEATWAASDNCISQLHVCADAVREQSLTNVVI